MSICSTIFISRKEAKEMALKLLMYQQQQLVENAIKSMDDFDLTLLINSDCYDYRIAKPEPKSKKEAK